MELFEALKGRRSVRGFKDEQIKDEELNVILEAGEYAATGMGKQSPIMIVVQDKETISIIPIVIPPAINLLEI